MAASPAPSARTTVRRHPERGDYDRATIEAVLDEALICHVGFAVDGQPFVLPTVHARVGSTLYLHGAPANRMLRAAADGQPLCVTATLVDALVLARSALHHSMNYRSVVVLATARKVTDAGEKTRALEAVVEHVVPGRWAEVRWPTEAELRSTLVVALPLDEASAKVRTGPAVDEPADLLLEVWAGALPLRVQAGPPERDELGDQAVPVPASVSGWARVAPPPPR